MMIFYRHFQNAFNAISGQEHYLAKTTRALSTLLLLVFMASCSSETPNEVFKQALAQYDQGNLTPALTLAQKAYKMIQDSDITEGIPKDVVEKDSIRFSCFYAICLLKSGKENKALPILEELADKHSEDVKVLKLYGESLYNASKYKQAFPLLKNVYKLDSSNKDILKLICSCAIKNFNDFDSDDKKDNKPYFVYLSAYLKTPNVGLEKAELEILFNNIAVWYSLCNKSLTAERDFFSKEPLKSSKHPQLKLNRAIAFDKRCKKYKKYYPTARAHYDHFLKADPNSDQKKSVTDRLDIIEGR